MIKLTIDEVEIEAAAGTTILKAAQQAGIYIPHICAHPDLPPVTQMRPAAFIYHNERLIKNQKTELRYEGCQLCIVQIAGIDGFHRACSTEATENMRIQTETPAVQDYRRDRLASLLARHPHACLTCAQKEGCARFPCSMNVPEKERCCPSFGKCEFQRVVEYIGLKKDTPRYVFKDLLVTGDEPLLIRNYNLCIGCTRCVRVCRDTRGVGALDFVFDEEGRVIVGAVGPSLGESACRFCTACVAVCPTGALSDKKPFDEVPCQAACPAGIDIPRYIRLVRAGRPAEALAVIREKVPFPGVLGHVCLNFCEKECRRQEINEPLSIRALKRFAADNDTGLWRQRIKVAPATGKKVSIIGAGPAGLTAAYYLALLGHRIVVFEALPLAGGMMRVGIPEYRLTRQVLDKEIDDIKNLGVEIRTGARIESAAELLQAGYDAVLIAVGTHRGKKLPLPDADCDGVLTCTDFLRDVNLGREVRVGRRVVVVGGGNVAFDCARTALRLGAAEVHVACLEPADGMLATPEEIDQGKEEGVIVHNSRSFATLKSENGRVSGVECFEVARFNFDTAGKLDIEYISGSGYTISADTIIFAVGQTPELELIEGSGIATTGRGTLQVDADTLATGRDGIFGTGDAVNGTTSIIEAIASGRKAAVNIDKYLGGKGEIDHPLTDAARPEPCLGHEDGFAGKSRVPERRLPAMQRTHGFAAVGLSYNESEAVFESGRCLRCELRFLLAKPDLAPKKEPWLEFTAENLDQVPETEGVYQLLDAKANVIYIKGTMNLRRELADQRKLQEKARFFSYSAEPMYTRRESELLQQYVSQHGQMPEGNRVLEDDLY